MKKFIAITLTLLVCNLTFAETKMKKDVDTSFSDKILEVKNVEGNLEVTFQLHAAIYKISKDNPKFKELSSILEDKKNSTKRLKIVSSVPSMEIKEIVEK